jgi:tetratricopeptide (TPR) repeat protein
MVRVSVKDAQHSSNALLEMARYDDLSRVLKFAARDLDHHGDWPILQRLYERVPQTQLIENDDLAVGYAKALVGSRQATSLLSFTDAALLGRVGESAARISLERSWAWLTTDQHQLAHDTLETIIPLLSGSDLGLAWFRLGLAAFPLGRPWREAFAKAVELLSGRDLGFSLQDFGYCLAQSGEVQEACIVWAEALKYFPRDQYRRSWLQYNIGITMLREGMPEAENFLNEADQLTRSSRAAGLRPTVLIGLSAARRVRGEWDRAEAAANTAYELATEPYDRQQAALALARSMRLSGRPVAALQHANRALEIMPDTASTHVSIAACLLALGDADRARASLQRSGKAHSGFVRWFAILLWAELARRAGEFDTVQDSLEGLPITMIFVREELPAWSALFMTIKASGKAIPEPLPTVSSTVVDVQAAGVLKVFVNQQQISLPPTSRAAEVLAFILEQGGQTTLERLIDKLTPNAVGNLDKQRSRKALWNAVNRLREALGWPESIQVFGGTYQLDVKSIWNYDINELRKGSFSTTKLFMDGLYSGWVNEVRAELEASHFFLQDS